MSETLDEVPVVLDGLAAVTLEERIAALEALEARLAAELDELARS